MKTQKKIFLSHDDFLFLYVYLYRIHSLLLMKESSTREDFTENLQLIPRARALELSQSISCLLPENNMGFVFPVLSFGKKMKDTLYRFFLRRYYLTGMEAAYFIKLIDDFEKNIHKTSCYSKAEYQLLINGIYCFCYFIEYRIQPLERNGMTELVRNAPSNSRYVYTKLEQLVKGVSSDELRKNVLMDKKTFLFLSAYMRQAYLSLDRARWVVWNDLQKYYQGRISPADVIKIIGIYVDMNLLEKIPYEVWPAIRTKKLVSRFLLRSLTGKYYLSKLEVAYCYKLLILFGDYLKSDNGKYTVTHDMLRVCMERYYSYVLEPQLPVKNDIGRVEHLNQASLENVEIGVFGKGLFED